LAAAAAILIAFGFIVYRAIPNKPQKDHNVVKEKPSAPQPSVDREEQVVKDNGATERRRRSRGPRPRGGNRLQLNKPFIRDSITSYAGGNENTTDFFPLSEACGKR
jgi:hypothetical protein